MYQQNPYGYGYGMPQRAATREAFLNLPENTKMKKEIRSSAIVCYVCAGFTLLTVLLSGNLFTLLDVAILAGLGAAIQTTAKKLWAILLTVYGAINVIVTIALSGSFGGWLPLVAGIIGIVYISKLDKAWDAYNAQNQYGYGYGSNYGGGNYPPPPPPAGM